MLILCPAFLIMYYTVFRICLLILFHKLQLKALCICVSKFFFEAACL